MWITNGRENWVQIVQGIDSWSRLLWWGKECISLLQFLINRRPETNFPTIIGKNVIQHWFISESRKENGCQIKSSVENETANKNILISFLLTDDLWADQRMHLVPPCRYNCVWIAYKRQKSIRQCQKSFEFGHKVFEVAKGLLPLGQNNDRMHPVNIVGVPSKINQIP